MSLAILLPFLLTCLIIEITPGPNMAYLAVLSASEGRKAGFAATTGIATGLFAVGLAAALGIATLVMVVPVWLGALHQATALLVWTAALWLVRLAWTDARTTSGDWRVAKFHHPHARMNGLWEGDFLHELAFTFNDQPDDRRVDDIQASLADQMIIHHRVEKGIIFDIVHVTIGVLIHPPGGNRQ